MKKTTIRDIAEELHLCRNTVTKALNNGAVAHETRIEVVRKAKEMGYSKIRPELIKELFGEDQETNKGTILLLFNRSESLFWNKILTGISDEVNKNKYRMQLHIVDDKDYDGEETCKIIAPDVKGIVLLCGFMDRFVEGISKRNLPVTFFNANLEAEKYLRFGNVITLEAKYSVGLLVEKVLAEGKREFGFIGYTKTSINIQQRLDGMLEALRRHNISVNPNLLFTEYRKDCYYNYSVVEAVIQEMPYIPEVIVCANDDIAKYAATALMKSSAQVAASTTLIGFDNTIERDFFKQDILTVDVHKEEVGRRIIKATIEQIECPELDHVLITIATYPIVNK